LSDKNCNGLGYECAKDGMITCVAVDLIKALKGFQPSQQVVVSATPNEIKIALATDLEQYSAVLVIAQDVKPPALADKFDTEVKVNREVFMDGLSKVKFAMGIEETKPYYKCLFFESKNKAVKFVAGSGARFAINDVAGKNIVDGDCSIVFPDTNIATMVKILSLSSSPDISIKKAIATDVYPDQIIIEYSGVTLVILGIDNSIKYAEVDKVTTYNYPNSVTSNINDWLWAGNAIEGTKTTSEKMSSDIHNTEVTFKDNYCDVVTSTMAKAKRKVSFNNKIIKSETAVPSFRINSEYLTDITQNSDYKSGEIIFSFEDKTKPVLVRFPEKVNASKETTENFTMFFATSKR
jgi:DNA polymerase III sliding clamp (beta) subunit (PCNA family)